MNKAPNVSVPRSIYNWIWIRSRHISDTCNKVTRRLKIKQPVDPQYSCYEYEWEKTTASYCDSTVVALTHWGRVNLGNLGHRLLKYLVIQTAAAELAAAVCITSHFNNHWSKHRYVGTWNDALDIRNPDLLSETVLNLPTPYGVTRPQWVNNVSSACIVHHHGKLRKNSTITPKKNNKSFHFFMLSILTVFIALNATMIQYGYKWHYSLIYSLTCFDIVFNNVYTCMAYQQKHLAVVANKRQTKIKEKHRGGGPLTKCS